jgi:hypothetical protein
MKSENSVKSNLDVSGAAYSLALDLMQKNLFDPAKFAPFKTIISHAPNTYICIHETK